MVQKISTKFSRKTYNNALQHKEYQILADLWKKLHEFLPDCGKIPGPSQHLQVTQWMASIDGKEEHDALNSRMEEKNPPPPKQVPKTAPIASSSNPNVKKQLKAQNKGRGKVPATKPYTQDYRIPKIQQDAMENVFQMARTMIELKKGGSQIKISEMISDIFDSIPELYEAITDLKTDVSDKHSSICNNLKKTT
ncbi:hypothetical protein O181_119432 [Austropuccinia psidii MF-1]|uniref:Uncharacterized protein n=1 Tax=Austropuccinia psidii MF-1 TaxID=1389203 RepID=A0A9Q3KF30_9BASI|nr:hypothetical protein [Austropuccinia psidii MF-1]